MESRYADFAAQIEQELKWREEELLFLEGLATQTDDAGANRVRRACVVMLYSHFEGYCKFLCELYVSAVNDAKVKCSDATPTIAAAAFDKIFKALRQPEKDSDFFISGLPEDKKLSHFAREIEFMCKISEFGMLTVEIPDKFIDTESNLTAGVLKKLFFRLGFPGENVDQVSSSISRLVTFRNSIAHGASSKPVTETGYKELRQKVFEVFESLRKNVLDAIKDESYLKAPANSPAGLSCNS